MAVGQLARRTDDDGIGIDGRFDVFPHGKRVAPIYHCHQHVAHCVLMPAVCYAHHSLVLSVGAILSATGVGLDSGIGRYGGSGAQRAFRAPSFAIRRHARLLGMPLLGTLHTVDETRDGALSCHVHHAQGVLLWIAHHLARFHLTALALPIKGLGATGDLWQYAIPRADRLVCLLCVVELVYRAHRCHALIQLYLSQSRHDTHCECHLPP